MSSTSAAQRYLQFLPEADWHPLVRLLIFILAGIPQRSWLGIVHCLTWAKATGYAWQINLIASSSCLPQTMKGLQVTVYILHLQAWQQILHPLSAKCTWMGCSIIVWAQKVNGNELSLTSRSDVNTTDARTTRSPDSCLFCLQV